MIMGNHSGTEIFGRLKNRWKVLLHDAAMIPLAWIGAYWLRFNLDTIPSIFLDEAISLIPLVMAIHFTTFLFFGVHRGIWRFISLHDLIALIKSVVVGTALVAIAIFFLTRLQFVPRSVFLLHGLLLMTLVTTPRVLYRLIRDHHISTAAENRVLIVGAGIAGELLVRDLHRARPRVYEPIAFVDDDSSKRGRELQGVRVMGNSTTIPLLVDRLGIDLVIIAVPTATAEQMQHIVQWCDKSGAPYRILPRLQEVMTDGISSSDLRRVEIDDLLGRKQVSLDWSGISESLKGRRILVTGGGGSIGSELCRQIARLEPSCLVIIDQSEFNLYSITTELEQLYPDLEIIPSLVDVRDREAVYRTFESRRPEIVFHAAAYKHVPLLEEQVRETVRNNVIGTRNVADAANDHTVESFVLISTDKAVNPTSMMGASKRVAEIYCQALSRRSATRIITVRFGNVLGSAGSVVPLFRKQIEEGGPVTVTDPGMTRYFMSIREACQLILQAGTIGSGGEIFVLNMGEPINIDYLARQMIQLSGKEPDVDIKIVYIGLRDGEKLHEQLFHDEEHLSDTGFDKIMLAQSRSVGFEGVNTTCDALMDAVQKFDIAGAERLVQTLVPEYRFEPPLERIAHGGENA
ncbi:MAG: multidrug MFS transporter [marine bacterium B5-7]|nr:MAG: multidrug MFS transporter [marine bacterium B5-7]